jgi:hypothetical protein
MWVAVILLAMGLAMSLTQPENAGEWRPVTFPHLPATRFMVTPEGVRVVADRSSGLLVRRLDPGVAAKTATWKWRVDAPVPATDLTRKGKDDRALAVHFWFAAAKKPNFWARLGGMVRNQRGLPTTGHALSYTWGGDAATGALLPNPFLKKDGAIIILRPASEPTGVWRSETVNLAADYRRIFDADAPPLVAVALSGDSDDTQTMSLGWVRDLTISLAP